MVTYIKAFVDPLQWLFYQAAVIKQVSELQERRRIQHSKPRIVVLNLFSLTAHLHTFLVAPC